MQIQLSLEPRPPRTPRSTRRLSLSTSLHRSGSQNGVSLYYELNPGLARLTELLVIARQKPRATEIYRLRVIASNALRASGVERGGTGSRDLDLAGSTHFSRLRVQHKGRGG